MDDLGIPAAPTLYWYRQEDLDRWIEWAVDTEPAAILLPSHTLRGARAWDALAAPGFAQIAAALDDAGSSTTVLFTGLSSARKVAAVASWFGPRMRLLSQQPWMCAMKGKRLDVLGAQIPHDAHRDDLLAANIATLDQTVSRCVDAAARLADVHT
jgi:hypothetical protein